MWRKEIHEEKAEASTRDQDKDAARLGQAGT